MRGCTQLGFKQTLLKAQGENKLPQTQDIFVRKKKLQTPSCPAASLYKPAATNKNIQKHANQHAAHQAVECLHSNASSVLPLAP